MATKKMAAKTAPMTKTALIGALLDAHQDLTRKQVVSILDALTTIGHKQLKRAGVFTVPGYAKFAVVRRPATKARKGINPFTKEPTIFKAKPASRSVRARPVKAIKDSVA